MDSYREHPSEFEETGAGETTPDDDDVAAAIGTDERRMHVRAYNYWVSLLDGRDFPSIEDLEPGDVTDFASNSILLDFTCGRDNPAVPYVGNAIREECGIDEDVRTINDVPSRSLLSRLTDHYLQIIANRAPIGFEAEFVNQRSENICYRGILMPFSSDGDVIDFIYGVINWKTVGDTASAEPAAYPEPEPLAAEPDIAEEIADAFDPEPFVHDQPAPEEHLVWEDGPAIEEPAAIHAEADEHAPPPIPFDSQGAPLEWQDEPADEDELAAIAIDETAGLADRLWAARETAEVAKSADGRTRAALYRALSLAYDFAVTAHASPAEYAELLEESGVKAQARAPMTPIVKLVFGIDYDKARLTEFAAALAWADRQKVELGGFESLITGQQGGLKALVAAEREARRPEPRADTRADAARVRLRNASPISLDDIAADEEFSVVITRRGADGRHVAVAVVVDPAIVERAIRRAA
jgi:hypothetical protein